MLETAIYLSVAAVLGGVIGLQRERRSKPAGLRTHMLVAVGTAFFVIIGREANLTPEGLSRVIQGVATGIGFIGGGVILKHSERLEVRGLTTAGSLWVTAALGVAAGMGLIGAALVGALMTLLILSVVGAVEKFFDKRPVGRDREGD